MNTRNYIILSFILLIIFGVHNPSFAQTEYPNSALKIGVQTSLYNKTDIYSNNEGNTIKSLAHFSGGLEIIYYKKLHYGFGCNVGLGIAAFPTNLSIVNPDNTYDHHLFYTPYFTLPITVEKLFHFVKARNGFMLNTELGIKLNHNILHYSYGVFCENQYDIELMTKNNIVLSGVAKIGIVKLMENNNTIYINCFVNIGSNMASGQYSYMLNPIDNGLLKQNLNSIGIEFIYGFNLSKK
ncbi:MAG: hypothetical protein IJZ87_02140 [Bacteroidales bacterium]|nr:hypothetical protein [Bacteroidales bacterium]